MMNVLLDWMGGSPRNEELEFLKFAMKRALQMENTQLQLMRRRELEDLLGNDKASLLIEQWKKEWQ